ncbi:MAG: serine/threonine-protein kinase [Planctomycetota bacterium]|nr:serine/threonine-protein kinase [Planctomycetota bacterium]
MAKLIIQSGPGIGADKTINDKMVVGRLQTCDLPIQEGKSSRSHFQIERIGSSFQLKDLGSRNGTNLNDEPVTKARLLSNGDVIQVGETRLVFFLAAPKLDKGDSFAGYEILSAPIPNACGYRFKARQRSLDREVVLETLSPDFTSNKDVSSRFLEMMNTASQFDHPNILEIYEVGTENDIPFASTPPFEGTTLRRAVRSGEISLADALKILVHAADALHHVNNRKAIHGRLSPSSILVTEDDYRIKLVGFGVDPRGRHTDPALPEPEWHAAFCSPEVGRGLDPSIAGDLYSLGAIAYWLVTGHPPYKAETAMEILRLHASPAAVVPTKELMPDIAAMIGRAIDRLLKKSPSERPENSRAAKKLLENALEVSREKPGKISKIHSRPRGIPQISTADLEEELSGEVTRTPNQTTIHKKKTRGPRASAAGPRASARASKGSARGPKSSARASNSATRKKRHESARVREASSERARKQPVSSRVKVTEGISDRLVSPEALDSGRGRRKSGSFMIPLVFIILLYVGSFFVTRILLRLLEAS